MAKKKQSKSKRHKEEGRKREERSAKPALKHERQSKRENYLEEDDVEFISFANQLQAKGLKIKDVPGDGRRMARRDAPIRSTAERRRASRHRHGREKISLRVS
eukprot:scpid105587/ scgid5673/ 